MKKNSVIYNKLVLQAKEAKEQGMTKLAEAVENAIWIESTLEQPEYSYEQMENDVHSHLWAAATKLIEYYDLKSANIEKIDEVLLSLASKVIDNLERALDVSDFVKGPLEPKLFGEKI